MKSQGRCVLEGRTNDVPGNLLLRLLAVIVIVTSSSGCEQKGASHPAATVASGRASVCGHPVALATGVTYSGSDPLVLRTHLPAQRRAGALSNGQTFVDAYLACGPRAEGRWESWTPEATPLVPSGPVRSGLREYFLPGQQAGATFLYVPVAPLQKRDGTPLVLECRHIAGIARCSVQELLADRLHLSYTFQSDPALSNWRAVVSHMHNTVQVEK